MVEPIYFNVTRGLRGCYQADESRVEIAHNFAEFAAIVRSETNQFDLRATGQTRFAWQHIKAGRDWREVCVSANHGRGEFYARGAYGLCVSKASESEYQEQESESEQ